MVKGAHEDSHWTCVWPAQDPLNNHTGHVCGHHKTHSKITLDMHVGSTRLTQKSHWTSMWAAQDHSKITLWTHAGLTLDMRVGSTRQQEAVITVFMYEAGRYNISCCADLQSNSFHGCSTLLAQLSRQSASQKDAQACVPHWM